MKYLDVYARDGLFVCNKVAEIYTSSNPLLAKHRLRTLFFDPESGILQNLWRRGGSVFLPLLADPSRPLYHAQVVFQAKLGLAPLGDSDLTALVTESSIPENSKALLDLGLKELRAVVDQLIILQREANHCFDGRHELIKNLRRPQKIVPLPQWRQKSFTAAA